MFVSDYTVAVYGSSGSVVIPSLFSGINILHAMMSNRNRVTIDEAWRIGPDITFTVADQPRHLTLEEQQIFHDSLWDSVEVIALGRA